MRIPSGYRHLIFACFALLSTGAAYGVLFVYVQEQTARMRNLQRAVSVEETRASLLQSVQSGLEGTQSQRQQLTQLLVADTAVIDYINTVEGIRNTTGASISVESVKDVSDQYTAVGALSLSVTARGSWQEVIRTLAILETMPRVMFIEQARIGPTPEGAAQQAPWQSTVTFDVLKESPSL